MGDRFVAFLCDSLVEAAIAEVFLAVVGWFPSLKGLEDFGVPAIPVAYMALTEFFFHGTVGKHLLGIQVRVDSPELGYPSLGKLLLRESLGKFVAGIVFGIGFLVGFGSSKTKTWADGIAGTVVVRTRVAGRLRTLMLPLVICAYFALSFGWRGILSTYQRSLTDQMITTENDIDHLHEKIFRSFFDGQQWLVGAPDQKEAYRRRMAALLPMLDEYNGLLSRERGQLWRLRRVIKAGKSYGTEEVDSYEKLIPLRQEIANLALKHAQKALDSGPQQSWDALLQDRRQTMSAINSRNGEINRIGRTYLPYAVEFRQDGQ